MAVARHGSFIIGARFLVNRLAWILAGRMTIDVGDDDDHDERRNDRADDQAARGGDKVE